MQQKMGVTMLVFLLRGAKDAIFSVFEKLTFSTKVPRKHYYRIILHDQFQYDPVPE